MRGLIKNEMLKFFTNRKLYAFLLIVFILYMVPVVMTFVVGMRTLDGQVFPLTMHGIVVSWAVPVFLIMLVAETFTEEYSSGTLSLSLVHPVSRTQFIVAKIISLFFIIFFLLFFALILAYGLGILFFGWSGQFMQQGIAYTAWQGISITVISFLAPVFPLLSFAAFIILVALLLSSSAAVVGLSMAVLLSYTMLDLIFSRLQPYLLSTYFISFGRLLTFPAGGESLRFAVIFIGSHGLIFVLGALLHFNRKDILN
ncbi:ABC transporter permease [Dethiobacter alkaliphilus]|uniref:ABC-2 type transport system permease protein n=1 Tax=Dethiobacter alkaliphilus AHT 1 TaxID=555088 RepID=C0GHG3_DETAL|nr:ABC transporter permease [Dethiobacter alkaliphilus]EEG77169.1 hypothetical protein DealDRAFT_1922 [Dethiobacter alkaliphilus AHT 1]